MRRVSAGFVTAALAFSAFALVAPAHAQTACTFTRDLRLGDIGEDVRCLQRYLNGAGYKIAASGVGSPGRETNQFKELTRATVIRWQQANGISSTGTFGPLSRAKYDALKSDGTGSGTVPASGNSAAAQARLALIDAIAAYQDALDAGADEIELAGAADTLLDAFSAFLNGNVIVAASLAEDAEEEAVDVGGTDNDEEDADQAIEDAQEAIDEAEEAIEDSYASNDDVEEAEELLDEAEELLADAEASFDDEDWDEAFDIAEDAQEKAEEAADLATGAEADENSAENALDEAQEALADAWSDVNEAEDDGEDVDDAEDILEEAQDRYDDAEEAFDDEDWDEAVDLSTEVLDMVEEALDTF